MKDILGHALRLTPPFRGKWRFQRAWERGLRACSPRIAVLPDGSRVKVEMDVPYERMVWLQAEEWNELRYLRHKLRPGQVFVDVGANIGLWTLMAASAVGPGGHVFSFEPNPTTLAKLKANVSLNRRTAIVQTFPEAVSDDEGVALFSCHPQHNLSAIAYEPHQPDTVAVSTTSLDALVSNRRLAGPVAGIKLDTEGHELAALSGASRLLEMWSPWLIVEFNTTLLPSNVLQNWSVYQFLAAIGYRAFLYDAPKQEVRVTDTLSIRGYRNVLFERGNRWQ